MKIFAQWKNLRVDLIGKLQRELSFRIPLFELRSLLLLENCPNFILRLNHDLAIKKHSESVSTSMIA